MSVQTVSNSDETKKAENRAKCRSHKMTFDDFEWVEIGRFPCIYTEDLLSVPNKTLEVAR